MWGFPRTCVFHNVRKDLTSSYSIIRYIYSLAYVLYILRVTKKEHVSHEYSLSRRDISRRLVYFKEEEGFYSPSARKSAGFMGSS